MILLNSQNEIMPKIEEIEERINNFEIDEEILNNDEESNEN